MRQHFRKGLLAVAALAVITLAAIMVSAPAFATTASTTDLSAILGSNITGSNTALFSFQNWLGFFTNWIVPIVGVVCAITLYSRHAQGGHTWDGMANTLAGMGVLCIVIVIITKLPSLAASATGLLL